MLCMGIVNDFLTVYRGRYLSFDNAVVSKSASALVRSATVRQQTVVRVRKQNYSVVRGGTGVEINWRVVFKLGARYSNLGRNGTIQT